MRLAAHLTSSLCLNCPLGKRAEKHFLTYFRSMVCGGIVSGILGTLKPLIIVAGQKAVYHAQLTTGVLLALCVKSCDGKEEEPAASDL